MRRLIVNIAETIIPPSVMMSIRVRRGLRGGRDEELKLLPLLARSGSFVDVGANIGTWTGPAAEAFRSVHAFEPDAFIADVLRRNVPGNVVIHDIALSDHDGVGQFRIPIYRGRLVRTRSSLEREANAGCEEEIHEVRLSTLDRLNLRGIDVIKIDVEGHEAAMLDGAVETIARERPTLIVEIEDRHNTGKSEEIIRSIQDRNYICCYLLSGKLCEFRRGSIRDLQAKQLMPISGAREKPAAYINNFLFFPHERSAERRLIDEFLRRSV